METVITTVFLDPYTVITIRRNAHTSGSILFGEVLGAQR